MSPLVPDDQQLYIESYYSVSDDAWIAEIWAGIVMWGEVREDGGTFTVRIWPNPLTADSMWTLDLDHVVSTLQEARLRVAGPDGSAPSQGEQP
jgi:hypothetical protein